MADHECIESYADCMASRAARIEAIIADNPTASVPELAAKAGVAERTIQRARNPRVTPVTPVPEYVPGPVRRLDIKFVRDLAASSTSISAFHDAYLKARLDREWRRWHSASASQPAVA